MRSYTSEAIVLARKDLGEADKILVLFTKNHGKLSILAKGVKKPKSRKRGHLEVFSHIRFSASKGKNLDLVTEVETLNTFPKLRKSLERVSVGYFLVETVARLTQESEINEEIFSLLLTTLNGLEEARKLRTLREDFIFSSLVCLGFWNREKPLVNPDGFLQQIAERQINSIRVGKKLVSKV